MTQPFVILTVLAYLASMGLYLNFLYSGKVLIGRLATAWLALGRNLFVP